MNTIALNYSQCMKQSAHWGYDKFYNICNTTGEWVTVPWGSMNWTTAIGCWVFVGVIAAMAIAFVVAAGSIERRQREMYDSLPF